MRRHSWMLIACLATGLLAALPARAQSPSPDAIAAAQELMTAMKATDQIKAILPLVMQSLKPAIVQG